MSDEHGTRLARHALSTGRRSFAIGDTGGALMPDTWTWERQYSNGCEVCPIILRNGKWTATVIGAPHLGFDSPKTAEFIVRACNSHADLLAALERLVDAAEVGDEDGARERASAAIAKAKGTSEWPRLVTAMAAGIFGAM